MATRPESDRIGARPVPRIRFVIGAATLLVIVSLAGRVLAPRALALIGRIHDLGAAAPVVFIAVYAAAVVAFVPATVMTVAGGAMFGLAYGLLYSFVGGALGSTAAFLLGRHAARPFVVRHLSAIPHFAAIDRAASAQGRRIVFLLRLSPVTPFNFLNYALGLTAISVVDFLSASVGSLPGEIVAAYAGVLSGEALALAGEAAPPKTTSYYVVLVAGLAATILATTLVARAARRALRDV